MKNIILVTHGKFAEGIKDSVELIMGEMQQVAIISVTNKETISQVQESIEEKIANFRNPYPIVIFTDILGGSTTQAAIKCISNHRLLYLISGLNLGLLLEVVLIELDDNHLENMKKLKTAIETSKNSIQLVNDAFDVSQNNLEDIL